jgi:uncharacterized protein YjdB
MISSRVFRNRGGLFSTAALAVLFTISCEKGATDVPVEAVTVEINQTQLSMRVGETVQLTGVPKSASGQALTGRQVTWSSANSAIAAVSGTGQVTATGGGSTTITATSGSAIGTVSVTVTVPVATVVVTPPTATMDVGQTLLLTASARDAAGNTLTGRTFTWSSTNPNAATVDATGQVRAVGAGSTVVSASTEGRSGASTITVNVPVASVAVTPGTATLQIGQTQQFTATARDAAGNTITGKTFTWNSSNPAVATVDGSGLVRAVSAGNASITASTDGRSGSATVTVGAAGFTLTVTNRLIHAVTLSTNSVPIGTVPAASTVSFTVSAIATLALRWDLVRPTTSSGTPVGQEVSGLFTTVNNPTGTLTYEVDNVIGSTTYFAPLITNTANTRLLMAVNFGLTGEVRCNCVVPAFTTRVGIGYYTLFSNTNVRGYRDGSGYTGPFVFWNFGQQFTSVTPGSGAIELPNSAIPSIIGPTVESAVPIELPRPLLRPSYRGPQDFPVPVKR